MNHNQGLVCQSVTISLKGEASLREEVIQAEIIAPKAKAARHIVEVTVEALINKVNDSKERAKEDFEPSHVLRSESGPIHQANGIPVTVMPPASVEKLFGQDVDTAVNMLVFPARSALLFGKESPLATPFDKATRHPSLVSVQELAKVAAQQAAQLMENELAKVKDYLNELSEETKKQVGVKLVDSGVEAPYWIDTERYSSRLFETAKTVVEAAKSFANGILSQPGVDQAIREALEEIPRSPWEAILERGKATSLSEAIRNFHYRLRGGSASLSASAEDAAIDELIAELNRDAHLIAKKMESEIESTVSRVYPNVQVSAHIVFQKHSLTFVLTALLTWAGGVVLNAAKEEFEKHLKDLTKDAVDRVWSSIANWDLSTYLNPLDTSAEIRSEIIQASDQAAASPQPTTSRGLLSDRTIYLLLQGAILLGIIVIIVDRFFVISIKP